MKPKIKFCGMTRGCDITSAEALNVDFLGLIFVPSSARSVSLSEAKLLRRDIRKAKFVGVFADHSVEVIEDYARTLHLDYVQLHGRPDLEKVKAISKPVIQAFRGIPNLATLESFLSVCPYFLLDKAEGADEADFSSVAALPSAIRSKLFLAGGLTPANVREVADAVQPFAVDTARGIEFHPGIKDYQRMFSFSQSFS
ncbi:MAG: phosphoribosylanthranilate isomerase [Candidatus Peregrinibacteria bacterium]